MPAWSEFTKMNKPRAALQDCNLSRCLRLSLPEREQGFIGRIGNCSGRGDSGFRQAESPKEAASFTGSDCLGTHFGRVVPELSANELRDADSPQPGMGCCPPAGAFPFLFLSFPFSLPLPPLPPFPPAAPSAALCLPVTLSLVLCSAVEIAMDCSSSH